jgi:hypothetical protein
VRELRGAAGEAHRVKVGGTAESALRVEICLAPTLKPSTSPSPVMAAAPGFQRRWTRADAAQMVGGREQVLPSGAQAKLEIERSHFCVSARLTPDFRSSSTSETVGLETRAVHRHIGEFRAIGRKRGLTIPGGDCRP